MWDLCCTKWHCSRFLPRYSFSPVPFWIELNGIWVWALLGTMHLGLRTVPLCTMFCTKSEEPCSFSKVPDDPYNYFPDILRVHKEGTQMCMSKWSQGLTLTKCGLRFPPQYHISYRWGYYSAPIIKCVRKVAVHLQKVMEVTSTSFQTGLNLFNFIRKHFL